MPRNTHGRRITEMFFEQLLNDSAYWLCRGGVKRKRGTSCFKKFVSQVRTSHLDNEDLLHSETEITQAHLDQVLSS